MDTAQHEETFEKSLNPMTAKYLNKKITQNDSLAKVDLRNMCENVISELESIENEASYDYLKFETEMVDMKKEIDQSDMLLDDLEDLLNDFKSHLGNIKGEMTSLQDRSLSLSTSLNNRRKLQISLDTFISNVMLEPQLIYDICTKEVNEDYVQHIKVLCGKLDYIKENKLADMSTVKEIEPELNRLKNKACQRVRKFLIEKLELLKKPKTNIQILQNNVLLKFKVFLVFLKDHYLEVFVELCTFYTEVMARMYYKYFKEYVKDINQLISEIYIKTDTVLNENPQFIRNDITTRATNIKPEKRSIFHLMGRESILNGDEDPIIIHIATQRNQRYTPEAGFKSVNKLLMDSVASEYVFTMEFFSLKNEQNKVIIHGIFKTTMNFILDYTQNLFNPSFDSLAVLLAQAVNDKNRKNLNGKGLTILDQYFDRQHTNLWQRFCAQFDTQVASITNMRADTFRQLEKTFTLQMLILRFVDLALSYYKIYAENNENHMLRYRLTQLKSQFVELLKRYSKEFRDERDRGRFLVENLDFLIEQLKTGPILEDDLRSLEKELETAKQRFVEIALKEDFKHLVDFVKSYAKVEESAAVNPGDSVIMSAGLNTSSRVGNKLDEKKDANKELVENTAIDFKDNWLKRIASFENQCTKSFSSPRLANIIMKKYAGVIFEYYSPFFNYVKEKFPALKNNIITQHQVMKEVKRYQQTN